MAIVISDDMTIGRPPAGKLVSRPDAEMAAPDLVVPRPAIGLGAPDLLANQAQTPLTAPDLLTNQARAPMVGPDEITSQPRAPMAAPDTIASRPADLVAPPFPFNHARILWQNKLAGSAVSYASGDMTNPAAVLTPSTYARATFTGPADLFFTLPAVQTADAVGIAAHNLQGVRVAVYYRSNPSLAYTLIHDATAGRGPVFVLLPSAVNVLQLWVVVSAAAGRVCSIGVIYAGEALQMQRPIYRGVDPAPLNRQTEYTNNVSEGGQWLGRDIIRQGLKTKPRWQNLDPVWLRVYFDPFASAARRLPFFYSWNPLEFPNDVAYCWTSKDIQPTITGPRDLMSVEIEMEGHA